MREVSRMRDIKPVLKLMLLEKKEVLLAALLGFLAAGASVGLLASSGFLISSAALQPPLYTLTASIVLVRFFGLLRAGSRYGERYFSHKATFTILSHIRTHYFDQVVARIPGLFRSKRSGDLLSRITGDVENLQFFFLRVVYPPVVMVLVFLATIIFASLYSFYAAVLLFVGFILTGGVIPSWFAWKTRQKAGRVRETRGTLSTEVTEFMAGYRELKIHGQTKAMSEDVQDLAKAYTSLQQDEQHQLAGSESVNIFAGLMITWLIAFLAALEVQNGSLDGVWLAAMILVSLSVFESANPMASFPKNYESGRQSAERLSLSEGHAMDKNSKEGQALSEAVHTITFRNVSFSHEGSERSVLSGVNAFFERGQRTAIVGASGSGKTSLMQVLLGIHTAEEGDVLVNGQGLGDLDLDSYWSQFSFSLQDNHFFYGSVRENLEVPGTGAADHEMTDVLERLSLSHLALEDLVEEGAGNLSGGERQRLALARAWLRNGPVWLLDEPLSALDADTYDKVIKEVFDVSAKSMMILITHQLRGLEQMDQILVMDQGRIVERGGYHDLMAQKGWLYELHQVDNQMIG